MLSNSALQGCQVTHQRDNRAIPVLNISDERFPEECFDVEAIGIDHGYHRLIGYREIVRPQLKIGDVPIHGRPHLREVQVQLSKFQVRLSSAQPGLASPGAPRSATARARAAFDRSRSAVDPVHVRFGSVQLGQSLLIRGILVIVVPLIGHPLRKQSLDTLRIRSARSPCLRHNPPPRTSPGCDLLRSARQRRSSRQPVR